MKTVDKLSKGKSNFETILAYQNCVFRKSGLGFKPQSKKSCVSKPYSTIKEKQPIEKSKQLVPFILLLYEKGPFCQIL